MCVPGSVWLYLSGFHGRSCSAAQKPGGDQERDGLTRMRIAHTHPSQNVTSTSFV